VPRSLEECTAAIDAAWQDRHGLRFNEGVDGRGYGYFSMAHMERLTRMLSYYPATQNWRSQLIGL